ncbi:MAG: glycosyltransferase family 39 protein, partial [Chloroflexi bacterium]|nr:glycosyltransferase family 39 protein [Chloroflexota bacterium]
MSPAVRPEPAKTGSRPSPGARLVALFSPPPLITYATVLVAFFLRAYRLGDNNVWWDEGWSVWLSQKDLAWIALRTASDEHPPLHYWMLHVWNALAGTQAFAGRFLSVAFGLLTVALLYRIGKRIGGTWVGVLAALLLAVARFHIWWSQDIKNYTPSIFFAFAALWFGLDLLAESNSSDSRAAAPKSRLALYILSPTTQSIFAYGFFAALAMWTHYLAALVLLSLNVYALAVVVQESVRLRRLSSVLWPWLAANALAAALFAPWLYVYLSNASAWTAAPAFDSVFFLRLVATVLPLGVTTNIENYAAVTIALTALAVLGSLAALPRLSRRIPRAGAGRIGLFTLVVALPPVLIYVLSLTPVSFFAPKIQPRYLLILLPAAVRATCG